jgi:hypothetical protein
MNNTDTINKEELLLLKLCRLKHNENQLEEIRSLISETTDWNYFSSLANEHGIAALVCHNLEKHKLLAQIPEDVISFFRASLMKSLSRNAYNTESMADVLRLLNAENIKTVLLKGLALELTEYGNTGLRQMTDVDVLISRKNCVRARNILIRNGFVSLPVKSLLHKLIIADIGKHLPTLNKNGTPVEIHHSLFGGKGEVLNTMLYETSTEIRLKNEKAYVPEPQIFFLYLIRHLHYHEMNNESQLRLYADLQVLLDNHFDSIINHDLINYADQSDMHETLAAHLEILREMWAILFPDWINEYISKNTNKSFLNKFVFFLKSPKGNPPSEKSKFYAHILNDIPGLQSKLIYLLGDLFPTFTFMKKRYNCSSNWQALFYYPHRLGKILWLFRR